MIVKVSSTFGQLFWWFLANFNKFLQIFFWSSIVILNNNRKLIGNLTVLASMKFDEIVMVANLLALDFELALLAVVLEVDKETHDTS